MPERLHPGVYVEEVPSAVKTIEGASTSTAAFIGVAERGPVAHAELVTSFTQYRRVFGGYRADSFLTYAVQNFFDNGGKKCYIVRVVGGGAETADLVLNDRERAEPGIPASTAPAQRLLAEVFAEAVGEPIVDVRAASAGRWGNRIDVAIQNGTRDPANEFNLLVKFQDEVVETWNNLSLSLGDDNYVEAVLGQSQSQYVQVKRLSSGTSDTPGVLLSGVLDAAASTIAPVTGTPVLSITLNGVNAKVPLAKTGRNTKEKVAAEIQDKVRAAAPPTASTEEQRAFTEFVCTLDPLDQRYVLISGSDASPRTIAVVAPAAVAGETDVRVRLKLDVAATGADAAFAVPGIGLQRGTSRSGNAPATAINGSRNLRFNLNRDGTQDVTLDAGLTGGDAIADNIRSKIRAIRAQRKTPLNEPAYADFEATYESRYELTFGETNGPAGTFKFSASATVANDLSADGQLRLHATTPAGGETLFGGATGGPLSVDAGQTPRARTIVTGSTKGSRPASDISGITDGELVLTVQPPGTGPVPPPVNLAMVISGAGPSSGDDVALEVQTRVRSKASDPGLATFPETRAALAGFTARYVAEYKLASGAVRTTDEAGNEAGPLSSVEVMTAPSGDVAQSLRLGAVNGGIEQNGAALLRPVLGEYHVGDNTVSRPVSRVRSGEDGSAPQDKDYVGDEALGTGLHALDKITDVSLIAIPGIGSPQVVAAGFGYCKNRPLQDCFFIADLGGPPLSDPAAQPSAPYVRDVTAAREFVRGLPTKNDFGAIYMPWLEASDPIGRGKNPRRMLPPSGFMAGIYAQTDSRRGVFKAPAGIETNVNGPLALAATISDTEQDFLNPLGINVIRSFPASGIVAWGSRTLSSDSAWRYVPVRRLAIFLRVSIYNGIQYAVFEPNDEDLWSSLRLTIGAFMLTQFRAGAFQGNDPKKAFFVKCDDTTTTQADIDNGVVNILVGFAPLKPAEFVVLKLSQIAGQAPV
jgi:phage tail sheath protein FI